MEHLKQIATVLKHSYGLDNSNITEVQGGFSARAFIVLSPKGRFFLKLYEKARPYSIMAISWMLGYTPVMRQLSEGCLKGHVPSIIDTVSGEYYYEDSDYVYQLYDYIDGVTIGPTPLTRTQVLELAQILGKLHSYTPQASTGDNLIKKLDISFNDKLQKFINNDIALLPFIKKYRDRIYSLTIQTAELKTLFEQQSYENVLCHTDIHGWNLMQTADRLVLIDWEGLKYAPREAEFFAFESLPFAEDFFAEYKKYNKGYSENKIILDFYKKRRLAEDIWEFIDELLLEDAAFLASRDLYSNDNYKGLIEQCELIPL